MARSLLRSRIAKRWRHCHLRFLMPDKPMELKLCKVCNQMKNHGCLNCHGKEQSEMNDELVKRNEFLHGMSNDLRAKLAAANSLIDEARVALETGKQAYQQCLATYGGEGIYTDTVLPKMVEHLSKLEAW